MLHLKITMLMGYNMSLNKIDIYMETNTTIEYKKYTIIRFKRGGLNWVGSHWKEDT